jgi:beta-N-acetylhexosaminidase
MKKGIIFVLFFLGCLPLHAADSLRYKIAQLLVVGFRGTELTPQNHIYGDVKNLQVGGVILFDFDAINKTRGRNITSPEQVKKLCGDLQNLSPDKLIISIDQEGGRVNRLRVSAGFPSTVSAKYLGRLDNADTTRYYARKTAELLRYLGFNLNFIPCVDLDVNPSCPVIGKVERSFSANPNLVVKHSRIWIDEHRKQGILTSPKHFPGHGSSASDSHLGLTDVTKTWTKKELVPYEELIKHGECDMVMVSHVFNKKLDPKYPATLSKKVIDGMIRGDLQFDGLVITDDMAMGAIVDHYSLEVALEKAINAGVDMLILSNNGSSYDPQIAQKAVDIIEQLVRQNKISEQRINEAYSRVAAVKKRLQ